MHRVGLGAQRPQEGATCGEVGKACRHRHLTIRSSPRLRRVAACLFCRWCRGSGRSRGRSHSSNLGSLKNTSCGLLPYGQRYPRARTVSTVRREIFPSLSVVPIPTWAPIRCAHYCAEPTMGDCCPLPAASKRVPPAAGPSASRYSYDKGLRSPQRKARPRAAPKAKAKHNT